MSENDVTARSAIDLIQSSSSDVSASIHAHTQESGGKRKRDIDDVGGTSHREAVDEPEHEDWLEKDIDTNDHKCWMKKSRVFRAKQIKMIRAKHDASELVRCVNNNAKKLKKGDSGCHRRWWLTTATQYNHVSLVSLLLAPRRHDLRNNDPYARSKAQRSMDQYHPNKPFYIAIEKGHQSLVQAFLFAGTSVTDSHDNTSALLTELYGYDGYYSDGFYMESDVENQRDIADQRPPRYDCHRVQDISRLERIHVHVSAVEYACIVNRPEILKLLVTHFNCQHPQRKSADMSLTSNQPTPFERITRPLHCIMKLTTKFYGPHLNQLPAMVQLIINTGEDIDGLDEQDYSPLQVLIDKIRFIAPLDENGAAYRSTIIEIMKILLKAGAKVNIIQGGRIPLRLLQHLFDPYRLPEFLSLHASDVPIDHALRDHFTFVNDLARLLLLNGADLTLFRLHHYIPDAASRIVRVFRDNLGRVCENGLTDEIMDSLSTLFQLALFAGANRQTDDEWYQFVSGSWWKLSIEMIADHSSHPGRSEKLIYMILNALSVSNLRYMSNHLQRQLRMPSQAYRYERLNNTIKYVNDVMSVACSPRSLQDLSRRAIIRAMSVRALLPYESIDLGLPPKLKAFVLL